MGSTMVNEDTKDFANEAATGGMMEVELGNIAMKNSSSQSVKDFGKMMVDDHTKINDQLKDLASKKGINLPTSVTSDQQKEIDKLSKKNGADFDKDYVSMMVDDHKKDIAAFKKNGDKLRDIDFKNFISNALPTLQKHLDAIESIKKKM
jgi:putative membrane protein